MKAPNDQSQKLQQMVDSAQTILVLQPEKPDMDSLGSALALEDIWGELGKNVVMFCADEIPSYLRVLDGWDRVSDQFPKQFDITVLVDTGGPQMINRTLEKYTPKLTQKPFFIIDHHKNREPMPFATIDIVQTKAANTELIANIAGEIGWKISGAGAQAISAAILADTMGLSTPETTADTIQTLADMVRKGADLEKLRRRREEADALIPEIVALKGKLLSRIEYFADGQVAVIVITPEELARYAKIHDPADLVNQEMRRISGVKIAVALRNYNSTLHGNKIKISMRANVPIAARAAQHFGGGGHDMAAGAVAEGRPIDEVKAEIVKVISGLLSDETI